MDRLVIEAKLESLRRCLVRIQDKCPANPTVLAEDADAQDIVALNLSRAIQLCVDVGAHVLAASNAPAPGTMGQTFDLLAQLGYITPALAGRMKKAVGFRNIAIHNYEAINWAIVHSIATQRLGDFAEYAEAISGLLDRRSTAL
ncbi:MAG: DUF86 domain-containing protein [Betaproteobacteria bacterium]|nr:DUF86 domain-containing protein [Betaproteobacteria bacterium]